MRNRIFKTKGVISLLLIGVAVSFTGSLSAQTLTFNAKKSSILIHGDSNHDPWDTKLDSVPGQAVVDAKNKELKSLTVDFPVTAIKCADTQMMAATMNKKTYEAFNSDKNPRVIFKMTEVKSFSINTDKSIDVTIAGNLTMAGVTKPVTVTAAGKPSGTNSYTFTGSLPLKFTDFGMKPPVAMFIMKVKDDISLSFSIVVDGINPADL
jgi:polyisoprenoid-binding protein YceI